MPAHDINSAPVALLRWYAEMGVDAPVSEVPTDCFQPAAAALPQSAARRENPPARTTVIAGASTITSDEAIRAAENAAGACIDFNALARAVAAFDGCALKASARTTVFADGVAGAPLLVIGEAPGRDEDRLGRPFVGRAGLLLDKMLASIGYSRETNALITNTIFWRPPGNRAPSALETAICRPFMDRLIEISAPKAVLLVGATPLQALLSVSGIIRARGRWREICTSGGVSVAALPTFHPAFLLRSPGHKRHAWIDLQTLHARLRDG